MVTNKCRKLIGKTLAVSAYMEPKKPYEQGLLVDVATNIPPAVLSLMKVGCVYRSFGDGKPKRI